MFSVRTTVLATLASLGLATSAAAVQFSYEFRDLGLNSPTLSSIGPLGPVGAPTVTLTGSRDGSPTDLAAFDSLGVGVSGNPERNRIGIGEGVTATFSAPVTLVSLEFIEFYLPTQGFDLFVDGTQVGDAAVPNVYDGFFSSPTPYDTAEVAQGDFSVFGGGSFTGQSFTIVHTDDSIGVPEGLWFAAMTVDDGMAPIPLPATAPLFAGALLLGGWAVRRRKSRS